MLTETAERSLFVPAFRFFPLGLLVGDSHAPRPSLGKRLPRFLDFGDFDVDFEVVGVFLMDDNNAAVSFSIQRSPIQPGGFQSPFLTIYRLCHDRAEKCLLTTHQWKVLPKNISKFIQLDTEQTLTYHLLSKDIVL